MPTLTYLTRARTHSCSGTPQQEEKADPSWIPCWDAIKGAAKYVQDTVVQMISAHAFADAFDEHMRNLHADMDVLQIAVTSKISHNINAMLAKADRQLPMKLNDELGRKIASALETIREDMAKQHAEVVSCDRGESETRL